MNYKIDAGETFDAGEPPSLPGASPLLLMGYVSETMLCFSSIIGCPEACIRCSLYRSYPWMWVIMLNYERYGTNARFSKGTLASAFSVTKLGERSDVKRLSEHTRHFTSKAVSGKLFHYSTCSKLKSSKPSAG